MTSPYHIVIPSRLASQRLPNKPLADIGGRPLIEHVWRRACKSDAESVIIATDSSEILRVAEGFGAQALLTLASHQSGSDRLAECVDLMGWDPATRIVNLQGDEPLMPVACLNQVADLLQANPDAAAASLYLPVTNANEIADSNVVKVVVGSRGQALYFSRSVIPHARGMRIEDAIQNNVTWKRHCGLYAYRAGALTDFSRMKPGVLEQIEMLEQLRFLEAGSTIVLARAAEFIPPGVDTPADLERVRNMLAAG